MQLWIKQAIYSLAITVALTPVAAIADSKYEATVRGDVELHEGPGWRYAVIGWLKDGAKFKLRDCTEEHGWCLVVNKQKAAIGWVEADSLTGVSAKAQVTPWRPLYDPFREGWPRKRQQKHKP